MRVTLSTPTFDPAGVVPLDVLPGQRFGEVRRRMNRIATLDGGAVFNDFGFSDADRTIVLQWPTRKRATEAAVERLVQLYAQVHLATPEGFYLAALEAYTPDAGQSSLTLLVVSKLA